MNLISRRIHGYLDYLVGLLLIISPWLLDFARGGAETVVPVVLGIAAIVYSLFTNYELGAMKVLPFRAHLALDIVSGIFLAVSPWIFDFADYVYLPHVIFGVAEILVASATQSTSSRQARDSRHHTLATH